MVFLPVFLLYVPKKPGNLLCLLPWSFFLPTEPFLPLEERLRIEVPKLDTNDKAQRDASHTVLWENPCHIKVSRMQINVTLGTFYFCFSDTHKYTRLR